MEENSRKYLFKSHQKVLKTPGASYVNERPGYFDGKTKWKFKQTVAVSVLLYGFTDSKISKTVSAIIPATNRD